MIYNSLLDIADNFDIFLFDAYGVFNFGDRFSIPSAEVMAQLVNKGKKVSIISNATALSENAMKSYAKKGLLEGVHYHEFLTSGQYAADEIKAGKLSLPGKKYYVAFVANMKDPMAIHSVLFKDTDYQAVSDINDADFVYIGIPMIEGKNYTEIEPFMAEINKIKESGLTSICANPDLRALETGRFVIRQGSIAEKLEEIGAKVFYYGKPSKSIFNRALSIYENVDNERVLMIGDTVRTDILGANNAGIKSCLTLDFGISADDILKDGLVLNEENIKNYRKDVKIDYIIRKLPKGDLF